ncbi:hypothetical protein Hanom_Chr01g00010451 [Helianthus anomalus]
MILKRPYGISVAGSDGRSLPTLRKLQSEISSFLLGSAGKTESSSDPFRLEKSKTERPRRSNMLAEETPQSFTEKLSANQKVNCVSIWQFYKY